MGEKIRIFRSDNADSRPNTKERTMGVDGARNAVSNLDVEFWQSVLYKNRK